MYLLNAFEPNELDEKYTAITFA